MNLIQPIRDVYIRRIAGTQDYAAYWHARYYGASVTCDASNRQISFTMSAHC